MQVEHTDLPGVLQIRPRVFGDSRGWFFEMWRNDSYDHPDLPGAFVQDNMTWSEKGVLRGLHFQNPHGQGKLVTVVKGAVRDIVLDVRMGSPTFGQWRAFELSEENHTQLYLPPGIAHGFSVTGPHALFFYKCTELYYPDEEYTVQWNDPDLAIDWQAEDALLSEKDRKGLPLKELPRECFPKFEG